MQYTAGGKTVTKSFLLDKGRLKLDTLKDVFNARYLDLNLGKAIRALHISVIKEN